MFLCMTGRPTCWRSTGSARKQLLLPLDFEVKPYWTERDKGA